MFRFLKNKKTVPAQADTQKLLGRIRPEVEQLMSFAAGPANKAMTEYYATLYFLWLARDQAQWKMLLPCLPEAALDSLTMMRLAEKDRPRRLADIRSYWRNLEKEEAALLRVGRNPLGWLENRSSGLAGIAAMDREFAEQLLIVTSALIRRLNLTAYEKFALPREAPAEKLPLSDIRPQPPRPIQHITLTDSQGGSRRMQVLDLITTADGTFACLRREDSEEVIILKTANRPDGRAAYAPAAEAEARLVRAVFQTRNPQFFPES